MHKLDKAACSVAAMFDLAAIGIEDAVAKICLRVKWGVNQQNLIAAHAKLAVCKRLGARWGHFNSLPDPV